ncbi:hypothetical protein FACS1894219_05880 [Clostridia bacterium]|nr:hypothetical protein FACS1894219_05880 [Clostridia bacterium]
MYVDITPDKAVRMKNIVGVFDLDRASESAVTRDFLRRAEKAGNLTGTNALPKAFVVTDKTVALSPFTVKKIR